MYAHRWRPLVKCRSEAAPRLGGSAALRQIAQFPAHVATSHMTLVVQVNGRCAVDHIQQHPRFSRLQRQHLALPHDMGRAAHRGGRLLQSRG